MEAPRSAPVRVTPEAPAATVEDEDDLLAAGEQDDGRRGTRGA